MLRGGPPNYRRPFLPPTGPAGLSSLCCLSAMVRFAAGPFQHPPHGVGAAAEASGHRLGKVHRHQNAINLVHQVHELLAAAEFLPPQGVQDVTAQLADHLGQAVQEGRGVYLQVLGLWDGLGGDHRQGDAGLAILFSGIRQKARRNIFGGFLGA